MITLIFNSIIYFVIDNFINLISDTKESFMCVFYFNNVKQNFNNQYVTIIEYKPVYLLNKYECLLLNSRNFEIQDIIASIENFVLLLKKDESKCLEKNVLEIIQLYIIDLIYNIFVSFNPTKNYQYIMEEFVKQKICYEQINYMNENLWNEIKKLIFMIDTWHEDKNCNFNHKFYIYGKEIKRFKWLIKFNSPFEIYIKENKLCIISSMSKIGAFFTWEDQVFVMGNTSIEENTFVGSNTIIFFSCEIGKNVIIGKNNIFHARAVILDNTEIKNQNIFGEEFCFCKNSFLSKKNELETNFLLINNESINPRLGHDNDKVSESRSKTNFIGSNNIFGKNVEFLKKFSIENNNIFGRKVHFYDNCKVRNNVKIGNYCFFQKPLFIYNSTYIISYNPNKNKKNSNEVFFSNK
ncbi:hypothetical protein GVAV_001486 [Gurleya vavrai]